MKHLYLAIENVGLNDAQRDTLIDALKKLGPPWSSEEIRALTPIITTYDENGDVLEVTGGDPITIIRYFHFRQPSMMNHWRVRLDRQAVIFVALFEDRDITVAEFKNKLANIFNVDPALVTDSVQQTPYGPLVTFGYTVPRLRFLLFGGINATWQESGDACRAYLAANLAAWEI